MSDSVNEGEVRVSITSPSPSRPPLPPSRNLPPAGTTPHVPSNLPVLTASDSPDEFGDEGIEDEDDGAETSDHVSDLLAAAAERNGKYNQQVDLHTGLNLTQSSSSNNIADTSNASNDQNELHKKDSFTSTTANLKLDAHTKPTTPHSGGGGGGVSSSASSFGSFVEQNAPPSSSRTPSMSLAQAISASTHSEGQHQGWVLKQPPSLQHMSLTSEEGEGSGVFPTHGIATYRDRSGSSASSVSRVNSMSFRHLPHLPSSSSSSTTFTNNTLTSSTDPSIEPITSNLSIGSFGGQGVALTGFPRRDESEIYYASKLVDSESSLMEASRVDHRTSSFTGSIGGHRFSAQPGSIPPLSSPSSSLSLPLSNTNISSGDEQHPMIDRSTTDPTTTLTLQTQGSTSSSSSASSSLSTTITATSSSLNPNVIQGTSLDGQGGGGGGGGGGRGVNNFTFRQAANDEHSFYGGSLLKAHVFGLIFNYRNYRVYLTAFTAILGLFFRLLFPTVSFWNNEAYKWLWFTSALIGASYILHGAEMLTFYLLKTYAGERENAYASHFKSYAALALVMVLALVMRVPAFQIILSDAGTFYFNAAVVYMLVFLCALILKNVLLHQIVLKLVFESRHRTPVLDCIFFLRLCRLITAPLATISPTIEEELDDALARITETITQEEKMALSKNNNNSSSSTQVPLLSTVPAPMSQITTPRSPDIPLFSTFRAESILRRALFLIRPSLQAKRNETYALEATFLREEDDFWHMRNTVLRSRLSAFIDDGYEVDIISARGAEELAVMAFTRLAERKEKLKRIAKKAELLLEKLKSGNGKNNYNNNNNTIKLSSIEKESPTDGTTGLTRETLSLDDLACCFETRSDLKHAFSVLDMDSNGKVGCEELVASFRSMYMGWSSTQVQLKSYGAVSNAIRWLAETAWWIVMLILLIIIFDVQASNFIIGAGTFFLSISFAIGPTLQRLLDSLIFVLLVRPYDVADIVQISGVYNNAPHRITQVNVLTTEMENVLSHKRVMARNADIITFSITNLRHSTNACVQPQFSVDHSLTGEMFNTLVAKVKAYLLANSFDWKPDVQCNVEHAESNKVLLTFRCTHNSSWQEQNKVNRAYSLLVLEITRLFEELQLSFMSPTRRFEIVPGFHGEVALPDTIPEENEEDEYEEQVEMSVPDVSSDASSVPIHAALSRGVSGSSARRRTNLGKEHK
jgi:small-conductance mechanosensitive channel